MYRDSKTSVSWEVVLLERGEDDEKVRVGFTVEETLRKSLQGLRMMRRKGHVRGLYSGYWDLTEINEYTKAGCFDTP